VTPSSTTSRDPEAIGRYRVQKSLGAGAMGAVYLAEDPLLKRRVAVKIVQASGAAMDHARERFAREAEISARLNHPNVITVYDVGEDPVSGPFLAIEFVDGMSVAECIKEGRLDDVARLRILILAMQGLEAAHAAGIVHRDVKPSNLMVSRDGRVKLMDFGIARGDEDGMTQTGAVLGTPAYIAPEQLKGASPSAVTDRYAFAVTAFELFTGTRPFHAETASAMLYCIVNEPPRIPPGLPVALGQAFARALAKNPKARQPTMRAFLDELLAAATIDAAQRARLQGLLDAASPLAEVSKADAGVAATMQLPVSSPTEAEFAPTTVTARPAIASASAAAPAAIPSGPAGQSTIPDGPKLAPGLGAGPIIAAGVVAVGVVGVIVWLLVFRGATTTEEPPIVVASAPTAKSAPAPPTAVIVPTTVPRPTAAPTTAPEPTVAPTAAPAAAATEAPRPPIEPPVAGPIDVARVETSFAPTAKPAPSARDLEGRVRREFRRRDLGHVSVRIDEQLRVSLANLHDSEEARSAKLAVSAVDPDLRVVSTEIRKTPAPPPSPSRPAWGTIHSEGAERND
jgi:serine/threonine-protein kinase